MDSILPISQEEEEQVLPADQQQDEQNVFVPLVLQLQADMQQALQVELLPLAKDIEKGLAAIQEQAMQAADESNAEMQQAQAELARLSGLVNAFQQSVLQFLG